MATLTNTRGDITYASFPIVKWEEEGDTLYVYGKASTPEVDTDEQVVSSTFSAKALRDWLDIAPTLRVQHNGQRDPAGSGVKVEIDRDGDGAHWVKSAVDEPVAKMLVKKGHLRAYSVGIARPVVERDVTGKARGGVVTGGTIVEVSLVDSPANRSCFLEIAKAASDGHAEFTGKVFGTYDDDILTKSDATKVPEQDKAKPEADDAQDEGVQEQEDDTADDDGKPEDTQKSYAAARSYWLAREPKAPPTDIGSGTALLVKQAAMQQWEAWDTEGHELGLDGTAQGYQTWLAKRNVDPNVGGGVDRDAMDAQDFIDPDGRRFPIHSPGDVSDAVSSYGRADPKIPTRKFKARLKAIARRKGPEFEAQLPESWAGKNFTTTSPNATGLVPYNLQGQQKPFRHDPIDDDEDEKTDMVEADLTKGGKSCKGCGKSYDADAKMRRCEGCGKKLPKATMVTKAGGLKCFKCGAGNEPGARRCADCGKKLPKMLGKAAQALLTKAGVHEWKHGWVWVGTGPNPRLHEHMTAHHEAMAKGKWAEAAGHLHAASMATNAGNDKALADRLMEHAGKITGGAPSKSGKMTAAEQNLHEHLAQAHFYAGQGQHGQAEHHLSEAGAQHKRLVRRHGAAEAGAPKPRKNTGKPAKLRGESLSSQRDRETTAARIDEDQRVAMAQAERARGPVKRTTPAKPEKTTQTDTGGRIGREEAGRVMHGDRGYEARTKPAKGPGHDSFDGRSRGVWQAEARRTGVKPRRGAPAHEIAGQVGEHHARQAAIAVHGGDTHRMGVSQDQFVQGAVSDFRTRHDAKVGRLGDSTGMGIYPTVQGNQAAHAARQARYEAGHTDRPYTPPPTTRLTESSPPHHGIGAFSTDPKVRRSAAAQARQRDEAARAAVSQGKPPPKLRGESLTSQREREATAARIEEDRIAAIAQAERGGRPLKSPRRRLKTAGVDMEKHASDKKRLLPPDVLPAGPHREPDGDAVEALEADAGMTTEPDETHDDIPASVMKTYAAQRMHDALCPAYDWGAVTQAYPALATVADAVDPGVFDAIVLKAAETGNTSGVVYAGVLHDNADIIIRHLEPAMLADARADMVAKSFGPPPDPEDYRRGYIGAGHATMTAPATRIPMVPPVAHTIHPDDFHRGLITEGHQAESPSDRGDNLPTTSTASGAARDFYNTASRAAVATTMKALHDHLVATIPGMCPMADSRPVMPADMQATNRPTPTDPAAIAYATKAYSDDYDEQPPVAAGLDEYALTRLIKSAVKGAVVKATKNHRREIDALRAELDELGAQPDPAQAPIRGTATVTKAQTTAPAPVPVERITLVEQAQLNKAAVDNEYIAYLQKAAGSDDPNLREQAEGVLAELLTKAS